MSEKKAEQKSRTKEHISLTSTLNKAIERAFSSMNARVADEVRLTTGQWPSIHLKSDQSAQARELINAYQIDAKQSNDERAALLLGEIARLHEDVLHDSRAATRSILEALRRDPNSSSVQRTTLRLLRDAGKDTILAQLIDDLTSEVKSSPGRNALLLDHGLRSEISTGHEERSKQVYERVLEESPENIEATEGLLRIALRRKDWDTLSTRFRQLATQIKDEQGRKSLLIAAALCAQNAPIEEQAQWLARAANLSEGPQIALSLAVGAFCRANDIDGAIRIQLEQCEKHPQQAAQYHFQISWLLARDSESIDEAIRHAHAATEKEEKNLLFVAWLCELLERESRWTELASALDKKAKLVSTREETIETLVQLAEVLSERLDRMEDAIKALERALEINPSDLACLQSLGRLYAKEKRFSELANMHLREAAVAKDQKRQAQALYRSAQIFDSRLNKTDEAIAHLQKALDLDESHSAADKLLEEIFRRTNAFKPLILLYRQRFKQHADLPKKAYLLEQIAVIYDVHLHDELAAISAFEELLELRPQNPVALASLTRLYRSQGLHSKLLSVLRAQAMSKKEPEEQALLLLQMGQLLEEDLDQHEQALAHYREAVDAAPSAESFEHLGRLLYSTQRWDDLIKLNKQQLEIATEKKEKLSLLFRIGRIEEQQNENPKEAAEAYRRALEIDGSYWPAIRGIIRVATDMPELRKASLEGMLLPTGEETDKQAAQLRIALSLAEQQGNTTRVLLQNVLSAYPESKLAISLLLQILAEEELYSEMLPHCDPIETTAITLGALKNADQALEHAQKASEEKENITTLRWLDLLTSATNDRKKISPAIKTRLTLENSEYKANLSLRLALIVSEDPQKAAKICRDILEEFPDFYRAVDLLEYIARSAKDTELISETLILREEKASSPIEKAMAKYLQGQLHSESNELWKAEKTWRDALDIDEKCRPAYEALKSFYGSNQDETGLRWTLEKGLEAIGDDQSRILDLLKRSDILLRLGEKERALKDIETVLKLDLCQPNALERLEKHWSNDQAFVTHLEHAYEHAGSPLRKAALGVKLARIFAKAPATAKKASALLSDAIDKDPDNIAALLISAEIHASLDQPTEAISLLSRAILRSEVPEELVGAHLATAQVFYYDLGVSDRASKSLKTVLDIDPKNTAALSILAEISEAEDNFEDAEAYLQKLAQLSDKQSERGLVLGRLARILEQLHGSHDDRVIQAINEAATLVPSDEKLVHKAVEILKKSDRYEQIANLLERSIPELPEQHRIDFLLIRGEVLAEKLNRPDEAREHLRSALKADPKRQNALELLIKLLGDSDMEDEKNRKEAITLHRQLLKITPKSVESIRRLAQLCEKDNATDAAFCAQSTLVFLNHANEEERYFHKQRRRLVPTEPSGSLSTDECRSLIHPNAIHPVHDVLKIIKPFLSDLVPPDLSHYGLSSLENALAEDHSASKVAKDCAQLLGIADYKLIESLGGTTIGATEPAEIPTLILPADFSRFPMPQQRFILGRMLAKVGSNTEGCDPNRPDPLSSRTLEMLLAALIRTQDKEFGEDIASALILNDMAKRFEQCLETKALENIQPIAKQALDEKDDIEAWLEETEKGAHRAGLLCAGNLEAVSAVIDREKASFSENLVEDIVRFSTSKLYVSLRQTIGISLKSS